VHGDCPLMLVVDSFAGRLHGADVTIGLDYYFYTAALARI
jgi:hypothetical protein